MANFTKIGVSMLHMDDIEAYLKLKKFASTTSTVTDTINVAGVEASKIAIAYD